MIKLHTGNCRSLLRSIPKASVDCIVTDPPYNTGMTANPSGTYLRNFFHDKFSDEEYQTLIRDTAAEAFRVLRENAAAYVFSNWKVYPLWADHFRAAGFRIKNVIVWDKVVHGLNYKNYAYTHEFIIFAVKGRFFPKKVGDGLFKDVWSLQRILRHSTKPGHHETVKPLAVISPCILHTTRRGGLVLDPFMGTGTTGVAAAKLERRFIGIDINPRYVAMARRRIKNAHKE